MNTYEAELRQKWNRIDFYDGGSLQLSVNHPLTWFVRYAAADQKSIVIISDIPADNIVSSQSIDASCNKRKDGKYAISFALVNSSQEDVFISMSSDIIEYSGNERSPSAALEKVLRRYAQWLKLLDHKRSALLGANAQKGLIAELLDEGYDPAALAALHSPIGLSIGAVTPREIAVAICAELIAHRRSLGRDDTVLAETAADVGVLEFLADAALPKALLVVLSATGSTPAKAGAVMVTDKLGNCRGTIGGGCAEAAALGQARRIIGTGSRKLLRVDLTAEDAAKEGMVCGGEMVVFVADVG